MILLNDFLNPTKFGAAKSAAALHPNWIKPKFCGLITAFNMDMLRFVAVTSLKE